MTDWEPMLIHRNQWECLLAVFRFLSPGKSGVQDSYCRGAHNGTEEGYNIWKLGCDENLRSANKGEGRKKICWKETWKKREFGEQKEKERESIWEAKVSKNLKESDAVEKEREHRICSFISCMQNIKKQDKRGHYKMHIVYYRIWWSMSLHCWSM